jgi:hypothetical protein
MTSVSYGSTVPPAPTVCLARMSMDSTRTPAWSVTPLAAYHGSGLMKIAFGSWLLASTPDSRMRL